MIHSMTAFARVQKQIDVGQLCWEIRSVNHRYLDASFRMPESFRYMETSLRACFRNKINRGKIECQLKYQNTRTDNQSMLVNKSMINALVDLSHNLSSAFHLGNDISVSHILAWPGVVQLAEPDMDELGQQALLLFQEAIEQLSQARASEGAALKAHIVSRLDSLQTQVAQSKALAETTVEQAKDKLLSRLNALRIDLPEVRVEQEIALILTRLDVNEELDRLDTHIKEVRRVLEKDDISGRRLDFLMQELNREANTLGSKSDSADLTQCAVEMKVLIEQMREQVQNIE